MQFNNWSLARFVLPKHTFSPKDLNILHCYFEKSEKQFFRLNFVLNLNIMTIAHCSELNNFSIAIASKREHISNANNFDLQVKMCCTPNKLFLGKKDLTVAYLTHSKIKTFSRCAYLNTLDVFKFYESRQCCTTNSLTTFHNIIWFLSVFW